MLNPLKVIIQDFPLFYTWYTNVKLFAIKCKIKTRLAINFGKQTLKMFAIKCKTLADSVKLFLIAKPQEIKIAIKTSGKSKIQQSATLQNKFSIKSFVSGLKSILKGKTKAKMGGWKSYLNPDGYIIGVPLTLGYWDSFDNMTLGSMDDFTNAEMAIKNVQ